MSSGHISPPPPPAKRVSEMNNPYPVSLTRKLQRIEELIQAIREARSQGETDPAIRGRDRRWALRLIRQEKILQSKGL
jgi:hypothetical protein